MKTAAWPRDYTTPIRREGNSWFIPSVTDQSEDEHRIDLVAGRLFCTCQGFVNRKKCQHIERVRRVMTNQETTALARLDDGAALPEVWRSPQDLLSRLNDMKAERGLVQQFFQDVMVPSREGEVDGDYGIIPGTDKPTLFKAGAEKLCELYGYAPTISDLQEVADNDTGHYRAVVRVALIHKGTGTKVAEGIGECNSREAKYGFRWVFESDIPNGLDKATLKSKKIHSNRTNRDYLMYRLDNEDLFSLWNTILKMAKKRALVDATLSATRSSGIFTQTSSHLDEWIEGEFTDVTDPPAASAAPAPAAPAKPAPITDETKGALGASWVKLLEAYKAQGLDIVPVRNEWAQRFPKVFLSNSNRYAAATEDEGKELLGLISAAMPACDHNPQYNEDTTLLACSKCGAVLEEGFNELPSPTEQPTPEPQQPSMV